MTAFLIYMIKWALCLAALYVPFTLLLRKETFASLNRKLLLGTVFISALLPLFVIRFTVEIEAPVNIITNSSNSNAVTVALQTADNFIVWGKAIIAIYFTGVVINLLAIVTGITRTIVTINRGTLWIEKQKNATIHCHIDGIAPFSWFSHIVISESDYNECGKEIVLHEEGHILNGHSWDILLLAVVRSLQWFNPFVYMLANDIKEIHEYEADKYVMEHCDNARDYQLLILKKAVNSIGTYTQLINRFGESNARKRITMMARKKSNKARCVKWFYLAPVASLLLLLFAEPQYVYSHKETIETIPLAEVPNVSAAAEGHNSATPTTPPETKKRETTTPAETVQSRDTIINTAQEITTPVETNEIETPKKYASETYYEYISLQEGCDTEHITNSDIRKCSVRASFVTDTNGQAGDISIKGCDISLKINNGDITDKIETIRETMIATAEEYIKSKEWASAIIDGEKANIIYDAHIIYHHGEQQAMQTNGFGRAMLVGSTPIN